MSFRCENCNTAQRNHVQPHLHTVETRHRSYPNTSSTGTEIVKQIRICTVCKELKEGNAENLRCEMR